MSSDNWIISGVVLKIDGISPFAVSDGLAVRIFHFSNGHASEIGYSGINDDNGSFSFTLYKQQHYGDGPDLIIKVYDNQGRLLYESSIFTPSSQEDSYSVGIFTVMDMPVPIVWNICGIVFIQDEHTHFTQGLIYVYNGNDDNEEFCHTGFNNQDGSFELTVSRDQFQKGDVNKTAPYIIIKVRDYGYNVLWHYGPFTLPHQEYFINPLITTPAGSATVPGIPEVPEVPNNWSVSGSVLRDNQPVSGVFTVKAFDVFNGSESLLGESETNADGTYSINYVKSAFQNGDSGRAAPNLRVKVFADDGFVKQSDVVPNATVDQIIDISLASADLPDDVQDVPDEWTVHGIVANHDGTPFSGGRIDVWDFCGGIEYPIGSCTIGSDGNYSVCYKREAFQRGDSNRLCPQLLVRVYGPDSIMAGYGYPPYAPNNAVRQPSENQEYNLALPQASDVFYATGSITNTQGYPVSGYVVVVKNILLHGGSFYENELGRAVSGHAHAYGETIPPGAYSFPFYPGIVANIGQLGSARFVIEVYREADNAADDAKLDEASGEQPKLLEFVAKSGLLAAAEGKLTADFVINAPSDVDISMYTAIIEKLKNIGIEGNTIAELASDEGKLSYSAELTGESKEALLDIALAASIFLTLQNRLESFDGLPEYVNLPAIYALVKTGNAKSYDDLLTISADRLQTVLISSITQSIVPSSVQDNLSLIIDEWRKIYSILLTSSNNQSNATRIFRHVVWGSAEQELYSLLLTTGSIKNSTGLIFRHAVWGAEEQELYSILLDSDKKKDRAGQILRYAIWEAGEYGKYDEMVRNAYSECVPNLGAFFEKSGSEYDEYAQMVQDAHGKHAPNLKAFFADLEGKKDGNGMRIIPQQLIDELREFFTLEHFFAHLEEEAEGEDSLSGLIENLRTFFAIRKAYIENASNLGELSAELNRMEVSEEIIANVKQFLVMQEAYAKNQFDIDGFWAELYGKVNEGIESKARSFFAIQSAYAECADDLGAFMSKLPGDLDKNNLARFFALQDAYAEYGHNLEKFWNELGERNKAMEGFIDTDKVMFFFDIYRFSDDFDLLSDAMMRYADKKQLVTLEDFVKLEKNEWFNGVIETIKDFTDSKNNSGETSEWPESVPGESDDERRANYASILYKRIIELFPMDRFRFDFKNAMEAHRALGDAESDEEAAESGVVNYEMWKFIEEFIYAGGNEDFDFADAIAEDDFNYELALIEEEKAVFYEKRLEELTEGQSSELAEEEAREFAKELMQKVYGDLLTVQRLYRLNPKFEVIDALIGKDFTSAMSIAHENCDAFVKECSELVGGVDDAQALYAAAVHTASQALFLMCTFNQQNDLPESSIPSLTERFSDSANPEPEPEPETGISPMSIMPLSTSIQSTDASTKNASDSDSQADEAQPTARLTIKPVIPNIVSLFGRQNQCLCKECQSVFSPSAYTVDLLEFLNDEVRDELFSRRPDFSETDFSCRNTNGAVAYIDLVNEALESAVLENAAISGTADEKSAFADIEHPRSFELTDENGKFHSYLIKELSEGSNPPPSFAVTAFGDLGFYIGDDFYVQCIYENGVNKVENTWYIVGDVWRYLVEGIGKNNANRVFRVTPYPQTGKDEQGRRVKPEHTLRIPYEKILDKAHRHPSLPFNLPFVEVNEFLKLKQSSRHQLYHYLKTTNEAFDVDKCGMQAFFEMTDKQKGLIESSSNKEVWEMWGFSSQYDSSGNIWMNSLRDAESVMKRLDITLEQFLDLMSTYFVSLFYYDDNLYLDWGNDDAYENGDLTRLLLKREKNEGVLAAEDYSRIARLQRLSNHLGLDAITTDRLVSMYGGQLIASLLTTASTREQQLKIDNDTLVRLFECLKISEEFSVSPIRAASWLCCWIENFNLGRGSPSQFEELFISNIDNPGRASYWKELLNDTETVVQGNLTFAKSGADLDIDINTLLKALNVNYYDLSLIAQRELDESLSDSPDAKTILAKNKLLNMESLAKLFRVADFSRVLGISVSDFYKLQKFIPGNSFASADSSGNRIECGSEFLIGCRSVLQKLKKFKISIDEFAYLLSGENKANISWLLAQETESEQELNTIIKIHDEVNKTKLGLAEDSPELAEAIEETVLNELASVYKISVDICRTLLEKALKDDAGKPLLDCWVDAVSGGWKAHFYSDREMTALLPGAIATVPEINIEAQSAVDSQIMPPGAKAAKWTSFIAVPETAEYIITASAWMTPLDDSDVDDSDADDSDTDDLGAADPGTIKVSISGGALPEASSDEPSETQSLVKTFEKGTAYSIVVEWKAPENDSEDTRAAQLNINCVWHKNEEPLPGESDVASALIGTENTLGGTSGYMNRIANASFLIRSLSITVDEFDFLIGYLSDVFGFSFNALGASAETSQYKPIIGLLDIYILDVELPFKREEYTVFSLLSDAQRNRVTAYTIAKEIDWLQKDVQDVMDRLGLNIDKLKEAGSWIALNRACGLLKKLGLPASSAIDAVLMKKTDGSFVHSADNSLAQSETVASALASTYSKSQWIEAAEPIRNNIRRRQRDALCAYLLSTGNFANRAAIYARYLIDVDMDTDVMTTRIVQANCSIQMFLQRAILNFENIQLDDKIKQQWHWMKNYRLWEASRKIFLYPENWLEPEFRDDKTPLFEELESAILQKELSPSNINEAFRAYAAGLSDIANLEVIGAYEEESQDSKVLHVVGRTFHYPHSYYYRKNIDSAGNLGSWSPWEKVDLDITADLVLPVPFRNKIYIFWPIIEIKEKAVENEGAAADEAHYNECFKYYELKLAWSEYSDGKWSAKRLSQSVFSHAAGSFENELTKPTDIFHFKADVKQDEVEIQVFAYEKTVDKIETPTIVFREKTIKGLFRKKRKIMVPKIIVEIEEHVEEKISKIAAFSFGQDNSAKLVSVIDKFDYMKSEMIPPNSVMRHNRAEESEENQESSNFGALEYPLNNVIFKHMPESFTCFPVNLSFFGSAPKPFFLRLNEKTLLLKQVDSPEQVLNTSFKSLFRNPFSTQKLIRAQNKTLEDSNAVYHKIINFYHPLADDLVKRANQNSLDDLLHRSVQANAKDQYPLGYAAVGDGHADHLADLGFQYKYLPQGSILGDYPVPINDFSLSSPFGVYNWELFFHLPMYIATRLSHDKQYEEAMRWFHYIFNPASDFTTWEKTQRWILDLPDGARFWNFLPFFANRGVQDSIYKAVEESQIPNEDTKLGCLIEDWKNDPFKPHLIARIRTAAYQKSVVMKYLDNLIEWGDSLFRLDHMEAINEATQLYTQASEILGDRPVLVPQLHEMPGMTYTQLKAEGLDSFSNTVIQLENYIPPAPPVKVRSWRAKQAPSSYYYYGYNYNYNYAYNSSVEAIPHRSVQLLRMAPALHYFCIPRNQQLISYWDTVEDRLFKIHHSMNIDGVKRVIPLFAPPIDPGMLARASAMGISIGALLRDMQSAPSVYRYAIVYQKAMELCNELKSFGSELLSALEKKDAENLSLLRSSHEIELLKLVKDIKKNAVEESNQNLEALLKTKEVAEERYNYYKDIERTSEGETLQMFSSAAAGILHGVGQAMTMAAGPISVIPDFYAGAVVGLGGGPLTFSKIAGGEKESSGLSKAANALIQSAAIFDRVSNISGIKASYDRRWNEWKLQEKLAKKELAQLDKQILSAQIRVRIAENDLGNHERQIELAQAAKEVMESKFSNEKLYQWMADELNKSYNALYDIAYSAAKKAEKALHFELGISKSFITPEIWDSSKKGLLAANRLSTQLRQLDAAYTENNKRELEITKAVSLCMLSPLDLLKLRDTGSCNINLPESLYDFDFPGHYFRRIKSVRLTIPCVTGPYTNISAKLSLTNSKIRANATLKDGLYPEDGTDAESNGHIPDSDSRFLYRPTANTSIAASGAMMDSGMFDFNFRDERYLPFEGAGAISEWVLELPQDFRQFDYGTISDVILHVSYTAREATSVPFRNGVREYLDWLIGKMECFPNMISIKQEFPGEFEEIASGEIGSISLEDRHFPHLIVDYLKRKGNGASVANLKVIALLKNNQNPNSNTNAGIGMSLNEKTETGSIKKGTRMYELELEFANPGNYPWNLKFNKDPGSYEIEDIFLYFLVSSGS